MADAFEKARDDFIATMERITTGFGMPALAGRMYGLLAFTPRPMSLDEISEQLHTAKSGVSVNIRLLENLGSVKKVWVKGDRRDYYEADFKLVKFYCDFFRKGVEIETKPFFDVIEKCLSTLEDGVTQENAADAGLVRKRLKNELKTKEPLMRIFERLIIELEELMVKEEGVRDD